MKRCQQKMLKDYVVVVVVVVGAIGAVAALMTAGAAGAVNAVAVAVAAVDRSHASRSRVVAGTKEVLLQKQVV